MSATPPNITSMFKAERARAEPSASVPFVIEVIALPLANPVDFLLCLIDQNQLIRLPLAAREMGNQEMGFKC